MAVPEQTPYKEYTANGVTTSFPLEFNCENQDHLIVTVNDIEPENGQWSLINGAVVFLIAPANEAKIVIQRNTPLERNTNYQTTNNSFRPQPVNKDFDRIWWKLQEIWLQINQIWFSLKKEIKDRIDADLAIRSWVSVLLNNIVDNGLISAIAVTTVESIADLQYLLKWQGRTIYVKSYYAGLNKGGGTYYYDYSKSTINNYGSIINGWVASEISSDVLQWGAKLDGSSNDTIYIKSCLENYGHADVNGDTVLDRFSFPIGAKLTGRSTITYTGRTSALPCILNSYKPINHVKMKAVYVFGVFDICEMLQIKTAGFNTIIHYQYTFTDDGNIGQAVNAAEAVGLKIIINSPNNSPPPNIVDLGNTRDCVLGFYIFDEPQHNSISVSAQDARIAAWKAVTNKPLCTADNGLWGFDTQTISKNFDIIFADVYHITSNTDGQNKMFAEVALAELRHKCPNTKIIPCVGLFTGDASINVGKNINFAKEFYKFGDGSYVAFSWDSSTSDSRHNDITNTTSFYDAAKFLNESYNHQQYKINTFLLDGNLADLISVFNKTYSGSDVMPFAVVNAGTAIDERRQAFAQKGIAFRNAGGIAALNINTQNHVNYRIDFHNYVDSGNCNVELFTTPDDFYTLNILYSSSLNNGAGVLNSFDSENMRSIGIRVSTSATSEYRMKFLTGFIITSNWATTSF